MMDISYWTQFKPKLTVEYTTKKYFNQYLYKLVVYAPCGRTIDSKRDIADHVENRKIWDRDINRFGHWGLRTAKDLDNTDIAFLEVLRTVKNCNPDRLKFRIEEPEIQIYAKDKNSFAINQFRELIKTNYPEYLELVEKYILLV